MCSPCWDLETDGTVWTWKHTEVGLRRSRRQRTGCVSARVHFPAPVLELTWDQERRRGWPERGLHVTWMRRGVAVDRPAEENEPR